MTLIQKFLFVTDIHNRSERDNPKERTDNFGKAVLAKQEEIGQIITENEIDVLLMGGDLFDRFDVPTGVINDVAAIWKTYRCRVIGVVGSHDYNGYQVKTLRRTGLGNFEVNGLMELVSNGLDKFPEAAYVGEQPGKGIAGSIIVTATPHTARLAENPKSFFTGLLRASDNFVIQMIHGDVFPTHVPWPHQTIEEIHPFITADLVLCGHIHCGWRVPIELPNEKSFTGKTIYVNPGSIGRTENGTPRRIQGYKFTIHATDEQAVMMDAGYIPITCAAPHPFRETIEKLEGSPTTDFTSLMKMISGLTLKKTDFKQHIPLLIDKTYETDDEDTKDAVTQRVFEALEGAKV